MPPSTTALYQYNMDISQYTINSAAHAYAYHILTVWPAACAVTADITLMRVMNW